MAAVEFRIMSADEIGRLQQPDSCVVVDHQAAGEDERRRAARLADTPIFRRVMGDIAEVLDEDEYLEPEAIGDDPRYADNDFSSETSLDATIPTPRNAPGGRGAAQTTAAPRRAARNPTDQKRDRRDARRGGGTARPPRLKSSSNRNIGWSLK